jgi:TetR/AcrR family transcriptional regulator, regulator of autoinduction and epiphytic fitness
VIESFVQVSTLWLVMARHRQLLFLLHQSGAGNWRRPQAPRTNESWAPAMGNERIERKRRTRRQAILDSAAAVLAREGYPSLSLDKVAAELDLTKAALYHYFTSKDDLVAAVIDYLGNESLDRLEKEAAEASGGFEQLKTLISTHLLIVARDRPEAGQLFSRTDVWNAQHHKAIHDFRKRHSELFRAKVMQGIEEGTLHPLDVDVSLQSLLAALASATHWTGLAKPSRGRNRLGLVTNTLLALFGVPMEEPPSREPRRPRAKADATAL